jgi:hypothetical protein
MGLVSMNCQLKLLRRVVATFVGACGSLLCRNPIDNVVVNVCNAVSVFVFRKGDDEKLTRQLSGRGS